MIQASHWPSWCLIAGLIISLGCDSSTGQPPDDAGLPDAHLADAGQDGVDADAQWPEQDQTGDQPLGVDWQMPAGGADSFDVLVANVGNIDFSRCTSVAYNLCWAELEETIAGRIAALEPDVVLLQEVLTPSQCEGLSGLSEDHACNRTDPRPQARRLLGEDYTLVCDARRGYECVGVHRDFGAIDGCSMGELCSQGARTGPPVDGCSDGFTISAVTIQTGSERFDVINAHPPSDADGAEAGQKCREQYLQHVFGADPSLMESDTVLVGGDFNLDPWRQQATNPDIALWKRAVDTTFGTHAGEDASFTYHSGVVEHDPPYWSAPILAQTLDHVVSNGLVGRCVTLGAHPGRAPLDRGIGNEIERMDHLAQWCQLDFAP